MTQLCRDKQPVFILLTVIATLFFFYSLLYAATKAEVMQAIAQEKAQVQAAMATHIITTELACDTQYWAHNMINVRYDNGVWYYTCQAPWEGAGVLANNVYYHQD
jgi:hypothetical protein